MTELIQEAYERAIEVLQRCITDVGIKASVGRAGYPLVYARDSMITALGAALVPGEEFMGGYKKSLETLGSLQTELGYIHRAIHLDTMQKDCNAHGSVDSNIWFILGHYNYFRHNGDKEFLSENWERIKKAFLWLCYQDFNDCGLIEVHEGGDWQDLFHIRGNVLYDNVLYAFTADVMVELARVLGMDDSAYIGLGEFIREKIDLLLWITRGGTDWRNPSVAERLEAITASHQEWHWVAEPMLGVLWERPFYLHYVTYRDYGDYFDTVGNSLAILTGLADEDKGNQILDYVFRAGVNLPYPCKATYPVVQPGHRHWRDYYRNRNLNLPHQYHNGGIWPMNGGFYVAALVKAGRQAEAEEQLVALAEANRQGLNQEWEFNEFLHGQTGRPLGAIGNAWSAGMYVYAYEAVKQGVVPTPFDFKLGG
ncbi:MAG: glycogen debranching protein [Anaerolineales bacterium]|nr:glycogen debranching protein [Anaerolineales bacterium]